MTDQRITQIASKWYVKQQDSADKTFPYNSDYITEAIKECLAEHRQELLDAMPTKENIITRFTRQCVPDQYVCGKINGANLIVEELTTLITDKVEKETKIEAAINDAKLKLKIIEREIMLCIREKETIIKHLDTLEALNESKHYI